MSVNESRIRELGRKYLNDTGYEKLEEYVDAENMEGAKILLLGAYDSLWKRHEITDNVAKALYKELGMSPEKASKLRQDSGKM